MAGPDALPGHPQAHIDYAIEPDLPVAQFRAVLIASTLGERRPVEDHDRLERMLRGAQVIATARDRGRLVGVSRAITDFSFCCYLSDLAVDAAYQRRGIGRRLIARTHAAAGPETMLVLLAAPAAEGYYPHVGLEQFPSCWRIPRLR
ncbi:MAG: GNAT family N-acetyltransferase [Gammaproteobacteria bacterium]|nr:GNAT family N-acetyltransferase [Gammaproteobacteria bacterium]